MKRKVCAMLLAAGFLMLAGCSKTPEDPVVKSTAETLTEGLNQEAAQQIQDIITGEAPEELTEEESSRLVELDNYTMDGRTPLRERAELLGQEQPPRITEEAARALCEGATDFSDLFDAFVENFGLPDLAMNPDKVYYVYWLLDQDESGLESVILHRSWHRVIRMHADNSMEIWADGLAE